MLKIPAGSTLKAHAVYDNTSANPHNPNTPPQLVTAGEATTDEMFLVFFQYLDYVEGDENLNAGVLGSIGGGMIGSTLGAPLGPLGSIIGGGLGSFAGGKLTGDGII
jgi:hypothetical protein